VTDAEWGLEELRADPRAGVGDVSALGHGGGGLQAMLFAMRNPTVNAVVNIDAGNFSTRSQPRSIPFYNPRLMRAPYLFIVTADTGRAWICSTTSSPCGSATAPRSRSRARASVTTT
jgi:pimeloyl-ACP methyl ester carboxylesterase